jgi:hypothetical protein
MTKGQTDLNGAGPGLSAFSSANANERHAEILHWPAVSLLGANGEARSEALTTGTAAFHPTRQFAPATMNAGFARRLPPFAPPLVGGRARPEAVTPCTGDRGGR